MYKIYDYQDSSQVCYRLLTGNCMFLEGCTQIIDHSGLSLNKYPVVPGGHIAATSLAFLLGILRHLHTVHAAEYIHLDINV